MTPDVAIDKREPFFQAANASANKNVRPIGLRPAVDNFKIERLLLVVAHPKAGRPLSALLSRPAWGEDDRNGPLLPSEHQPANVCLLLIHLLASAVASVVIFRRLTAPKLLAAVDGANLRGA